MKQNKHFSKGLFSILLTCLIALNVNAAEVIPYLPPLQNFGGDLVDLNELVPETSDFTLEVQGLADVEISISGGYYLYTPTATSTVRISQKNGVAYVYEDGVYKATITPDISKITYPDIFGDANNSATNTGIYDTRNILKNPGFQTIPNNVWKAYNHNSDNLDITNLSGSGTSIRSTSQITESNALLFHQTARYLTQSIDAGQIKSNSYYRLAFKYKTNAANQNQNGAIFRGALGTTERSNNIIVTPTRTTQNNTTIHDFNETFKIEQINDDNPVWFMVERTSGFNNSPQRLEWYDNFALVRGVLPQGVSGTSGSTGTYLNGVAYSPDGLQVDYSEGDVYDMTSYIVNPSFETSLALYGWTNTNSMARQSNVPNQGWTKDGTYYAERWVSSGTNLPAASLTQTISGLPNGKYRMTLSAHAIQQSNLSLVTTGASAFANEASTDVNVGGDYSVENIVVTNGTINLGYRLVAPITCNWTGFDNFRLYYQGEILDPVVSAPQTSISFTTASNSALIELTGANLSEDISITVPSSSIVLTGDNVTGTSPNFTIALANANQLNEITATWDKALNVSGNIIFTSDEASKTIEVTSQDVETVALTGITTTVGVLSPVFEVATTTYNLKVPANVASATINATANPAIATVTNNGAELSASNTSVVLTGNSYNEEAQTADYTVNWDGSFTIADWDANGTTDAILSVPTVYGWSATPTLSWVNANSTAGGTVRYMDMVNGANAGVGGVTYTHNAVNYDGRIMFVRWDGAGNASRVYSYPVHLEACKIYNFSAKAAYNSVASAGTLTFRINTENNNTGTTHASGTIVTTSAGTLIAGGINEFSVPTTGVYYLTITSSAANLCAIADLQLDEILDENLIVNRSYLFFDNSNDGVSKIFNVSANLSEENITLSAPAGITLSQTTITPEEAQCGVNITATFDNAANITAQNISITNGSLSANILVDAVANNLIGNWDADGSTDATESVPTHVGWASAGATWVAANLGTVGSVRYFDSPSGYTYSGNTYSGRVLFMRWDGSHSETTNAVYSLPVALQSGKTYGFKGKFAWNSNSSSPVITTRINSMNTNSGPTLGIGSVTTGAFGVLIDGSFEFSVPETGTYYLTFNGNTESFNAITDLAIYEVSDVANVNMLIESADYALSSNISANSVTVRPGLKLTVNSEAALNSASLVLEGNADGTATFLNNGSINVTSATVQQHLAAGRNWYFASPVVGAQSGVVTATVGNSLWKRNVGAGQWTTITAEDETLTPLRGYVASKAESGLINFTGELNDGALSYTLTGHPEVTSGMFHLVGNPYASYLNWQSVIAANEDLMPTLWFRTKTADEGAGNQYAFATVQIATGEAIVIRNNAATDITRFIPPMQAFWVRMNNGVTTTQFAVNNTMRSHADMAGNRLKAPAAINKLLRLEVTNGSSIDESVVYFNQHASNAFDRYDSPKMFNNAAAIPEIYTRIGNEKLAINGMSHYVYGTQIGLGFKAGVTNNYSIRATEWINFDPDTRVVLIDHHTNEQVDMTEGDSYHFSSDATDNDTRFSILFKSAAGTTGDCCLSLLTSTHVHSTNGNIVVNCNVEIAPNARFSVYNNIGQLVHSQDIREHQTVTTRRFEAGIYLIKVENGGQTAVLRAIIH